VTREGAALRRPGGERENRARATREGAAVKGEGEAGGAPEASGKTEHARSRGRGTGFGLRRGPGIVGRAQHGPRIEAAGQGDDDRGEH